MIPAVRKNWPDLNPPIIKVLKDNNPVRMKADDPQVVDAGQVYGCYITLMSQPPNSPYLNILVLGVFRAIQSLQYKAAPRNVNDLVHAAVAAYLAFVPRNFDEIFLTLMQT